MAAPRHRYSMTVREIPHRHPRTPDEKAENRRPIEPLRGIDWPVIEAKTVDEARGKAIEAIEATGRDVRSANITPDGRVVAVAYRPDESEATAKS